MTTTDYGSLAGAPTRAALTMTHRLHRPDASRMGVVLCTERQGLPHHYVSAPHSTTPRLLAAAGFVVATGSSDATGLSYGNDTAVATVGTVRASHMPGVRADKVALYGRSMGAAQALGYARLHKAEVHRVALCCPLVSMVAAHFLFEAEVDAAYGSHAAYLAALPTHDPTAFAGALAGLPIRIWAGEVDTTVTLATVQAFAAAVGPSCEVVVMPGVGHDVNAAPARDVVEFLAGG